MGKAKTRAIEIARRLDHRLARLSSRYLESPPGVVVFLFHSIIPDADWSEKLPLNYRYALQKSKLFEMVEYFKDRQYEFISAADINGPLDKEKSYLCMTFDDGYANNQEIIEELAKEEIPTTLFATSGNIASGESFWWDVLYRQRARTTSIEKILQEENMLNSLPNADIRQYLFSEFSITDLQPVGDFDRPLSVKELQSLSQGTGLKVGNHTFNHENLSSLSPEEINQEISRCQSQLADWGLNPLQQIAYPGGVFDSGVLEQVKDQKFQIGYTDRYIRNELGANGAFIQPLRLGRFIISCRRDVKLQCQLADAKYSLLKSYSSYREPSQLS